MLDLAARSSTWGAVGSLLWAVPTRLPALRRKAVRDALAAALVTALRQTWLSALVVSVLLGVTLLQFVLPILPWFGSRPEALSMIFLFTIQHLGDLVAGVLVVGQAGLAASTQVQREREQHRFLAVTVAGIDPLEYFVLPRVWALTVAFVAVGMVFKVTAVAAAAWVNQLLDGRFLGAEIGLVLEANGPRILAGYVVNLVLGCLIAVVCCAPESESPHGRGAAISGVFRRALVLLFAGKLFYFGFLW